MYTHRKLHSRDGRKAEASHSSFDTYRIKSYHQFQRNDTIRRMIRRAHDLLEEYETENNSK